MRTSFLFLLGGLLLSLSPASAAPPQAASPGAATTPVMHTPTNLTPAEAESLIHASSDLVVLDVRTQEEFAEGHIAGARNVNFNSPTFGEQMKAFAGKKVLLHCASGGRSTRALSALSEISFEKLYHLNKGFNAWVEAGKPVSTKP
ncbi:MAG: Rhodanese-related sulfurtransferase [Verrucomicrobia bacterium]|nr:MAG: Rhodanese-related sulfurtransferase [Verrucomicrobiota bacterium]